MENWPGGMPYRMAADEIAVLLENLSVVEGDLDERKPEYLRTAHGKLGVLFNNAHTVLAELRTALVSESID